MVKLHELSAVFSRQFHYDDDEEEEEKKVTNQEQKQ